MDDKNAITKADPFVLALEEELGEIDQERESWLPEWFMKKIAEIKTARAALKAEYDHRKTQLDEDMAGFSADINAQERALFWRHGKQFEVDVRAELAIVKQKKPKAKSVKYWGGRAGTEIKATKIVIDGRENERLAVEWAKNNGCEKAIDERLARKKLLTDHFDKTGVIPDGCHVVPGEDRFFPAMPQPRLNVRSLAKGLPQEQNNATD